MKRRWSALMAVLGLLVVAGGGVRAEHTQPAQIHACVTQKTVDGGTVSKLKKLVSDPTLCKPGKEVFLEWDETGEPGSGIQRLPFSRTSVDSDGTTGQYTSLAIGRDGNPVVSYYDNDSDQVLVAVCNDLACAGGDETINPLASIVTVTTATSIAVGADGNPIVSFDEDGTADLMVVHCEDPSCSTVTPSTVDNGTNVGDYSSIAIGADDLPVISYYDAATANGDMKVAKCNDIACSGGGETITAVEATASDFGRYTSIAIGTDGNPVVSYSAGSSGLKVARCNDPACTGGNETLSVVDTVSSPAHTSIAVGTDGNPVISYQESSTDLKVARCNDPACDPVVGGAETITIVQSTGFVGNYSSIAIGIDGNPVVSHLEGGAPNDLWVVHCNDPACAAGGETFHAVDDGGLWSSIAIGLDGNPVVGFFSNISPLGDLRVVRCSNIACTPNFRSR